MALVWQIAKQTPTWEPPLLNISIYSGSPTSSTSSCILEQEAKHGTVIKPIYIGGPTGEAFNGFLSQNSGSPRHPQLDIMKWEVASFQIVCLLPNVLYDSLVYMLHTASTEKVIPCSCNDDSSYMKSEQEIPHLS